MDLSKELQHPVFSILSDLSREEGTDCYVIGGYVRDLLLFGSGSKPKDIDILVIGSGIDMARKVRSAIRGKASLSVFRSFGTAMLKWGDTEIEFVGARKESYRNDSRKPLVEDGTLEDDQKRRDFTINALAIDLKPERFGRLLDPFDGQTHLKEKRIRTPLEPGRTFSDDPLRMLRGIRFAARLEFRIDPDILDAMREHRERIAIVSQERITEELNKILLCRKPSIGFMLLEKTGLLSILLPDLDRMKGVEEVSGQFHKDNFLHTLEVVDNIAEKTDDLWLRWSALLHDIAKPRTKRFEEGIGWTFHGHEFLGAKMIPSLFRKLKLPLDDRMKYVQKLVQLHLRPIVLSQEVVSDSAVRRLIYDAGDDLEDLMTLCEADITSKNEYTVRKHLKNFQIVREKMVDLEARDSIRNFQPPVSGDDIQKAFGIEPSRPIGIIKEAIKEAILEGEISNTREAAIRKMREEGKKLGLTFQAEAFERENPSPDPGDAGPEPAAGDR
ncbi:MAG: HD domain-containing protein [Bacteroidales bacterium]